MPKSTEDLSRLCEAINRARLTLQRPRENRLKMVRQFVGPDWAEDGAKELVPINLISLYVNVVARQLVAKNPRVMLSTFLKQHKPTVAAMQTWANKEIVKMQLAQTLQRNVLDALFSIGICKVALATPAEAAHSAWGLQAGAPFAAAIDLDDFVFDIHARDFGEAGFIGHRYRVPLEVVRDSKIYDVGRKDLTANSDPTSNEQGDARISALGRGSGTEEEYEDHVDLWEIYCPRHRLVYTFADDNGPGLSKKGNPLRVQPWIGPDSGPIHILGYGMVPGNALPKAPIQDLLTMHEFVNALYRKLMRQALRQKTNTFVRGGADADGSRVMQSEDGEVLRVDNPENIREVAQGGAHLPNHGIFGDALQRFNYLAGNIESAGGLGPQSKTATQDKMLEASASGAITDKQDFTVAFVEKVVNSLCWYWHHDPTRTMKSNFALPGMPEISVEQRVSPQQRQQVAYEDLDVKVDPYSMRHSTPEKRAAALDQVVMQIVMPMMQLLQQQGISFDINAFLKKRGEYLDMPDLEEIITLRAPAPQESGGASSGDEPGMPQETTRNYVRESMPGRTQKGNDLNMVSAMMGVKPGGAPDTNGAMQ